MPDEYRLWPSVLEPAQILPNPVPFTRSGGRSLGGLQRSIRTDRGYWSIEYRSVALHDRSRRAAWNAIRTWLSGTSGLVAIPVWSFDSALAVSESNVGLSLVPHSDGTGYEGGHFYSQPSIIVQASVVAEIGDTSISLRLVHGVEGLEGIRFSYNHALYETGSVINIDEDAEGGAVWTVPVFPAIRATIPADAYLEFDLPTCLVRLAADREMDVSLSPGRFDLVNVSFVEAADYWSDLAAEEAAES